MISKYNGICAYCGKPTKAGIDQYSLEFKKGYHLECEIDEENQKPTLEQCALADKLGFRDHSDWAMLLLPPADPGGSTGREEPEASGRDTLWEMPTVD